MKDYSNYHTNRKDKIVHDAEKMFKFNTTGFSGQEVLVNNEYEINAIVYDKYSMSQSLKTIITRSSEAKLGDLVKLEDDSYYLITMVESENEVTKKWVSKKCNIDLKWIDEEGIIQSSKCILEYNTRSNFGVDEDKVMTLPDGRRQVTLQLNNDTKKIAVREQRFIIGGLAYKVNDADFVSDEGLVNLSLTSDQINPAIDNVELEIADYNKLATFDIKILNESNISISQNQTLQLNVEVYKNGNKINDLPTYSSEDESILTVDENGLVTPVNLGRANVNVSYADVVKTISVLVREIQYNNFTVEIVGSDSIVFGQKRIYEAIFKNNGMTIDEQAVFTLTADDEVSSANTLATMRNVDNKNVEITANSNNRMGYVKLHVKSANELMSNNKRIQIKGFL